ncbi:MAG: EpsG family protein [Halieaceae bacterium]|nr:EpsG family protein [Halieaceae bacterium]
MLFALPAIGAISQRHLLATSQRAAWWCLCGILIVSVGLRFEVGGDWFNYLGHFTSMRFYSLLALWDRGDPGYYWINWLVFHSGGSIVWVNLICAGIVVAGVSRFARHQPLPWVALAVAVPYLLIVVAMGYTRQAAALGFAMIGLAALGQYQIRRFVAFVFIGALFHKSAVLLLPIAALAATRNRLWTAFWVSIIAATGSYLFLAESAEVLWENYVQANYHSRGGMIRVMMNAVPSVLLLSFRNRLFYNEQERRLWLWMAALSLLTVPLVLVSSTAIDRLALYFIPIQMFTFARLPLLAVERQGYQLIVAGIVAYYAAVLFVWLNYASHAYAWLPYRNYLFL